MQLRVHKIMLLLSLVILFLMCNVSSSEVGDCLTPSGHNGTCQPINHCPSLYSLFRANHRKFSSGTAAFLRQSQCGTVGIYPKVCCPDFTNELLPELCGNTLQEKIHGGDVAKIDEFPWMALLEYQIKGNRSFGCGGVLINKRYVLTARHCIKEYLVSVRLGEHNTQTDPDCVGNFIGEDCNDRLVTVGIEKKISYEGAGDIALLRLKQDVDFTDFIKPICLPFSVDGLTKIGTKLTVAGWGLTEKKTPSPVKLKVQVPVRPASECTNALRLILHINLQLHEGELCAGGEEGKDSCNGDSGGPLMGISMDNDGNQLWYVVGLVSFGPTNPCGRKDKPAIYVKVSKHLDWILENLKP